MTDNRKYRFDYEHNGLVGEVKLRLRALSALRAMILKIASYLAVREKEHGFVLLVDPVISSASLQQEWRSLERTLQRHIVDRMSLFTYEKNDFNGWPEQPGAGMKEYLQEALGLVAWPGGYSLPRPDYSAVILGTLLQQKLTKTPPESLTVKSIGQLAGCSYPTVAARLKHLDYVLQRSQGQGVELKRFPVQEWKALVLQSRKARSSKYFRDRSGKPRTPAALLDRLARMELDEVAVGGAIAAETMFPEIDIIGNPRLDLCVHAPGKTVDLGFIEALDPALQETGEAESPVHVALHFTRSQESYFSELAPGLKRVGLVDCLLDLHDMHFDRQANEWLAALVQDRFRAND
jgi:hypothetical protein